MNVGIDIIEVKRIEKSIKNPKFVSRVYSEDEIKIISQKKNAETAAGRFCVKEAFSKALGTGVRDFELKEVSTLNDELGRPYIEVTGNAKKLLNGRNTSVSISHTSEYATAVVIIF